MPFEKGNTLGQKGKLFDKNLRAAIAQDDGKKIRAAAEKLLDKAADGEPWAIQMLSDRLDGRAAQSVEVSGQITVAERVSVFAAFMELAAHDGEAGTSSIVGEERSLLPASLSASEDRH